MQCLPVCVITSRKYYQSRSCVKLGQLVCDHRVTYKRNHVGLAVPKHTSGVVQSGVHSFDGFR